MRTNRLFSMILAAVVLATAQTAFAAVYPLELTNIGPVGSNGMSSNNRIFRAYPGLFYNIRAAVVGGAYPFTFRLSNAPSGMTINDRTGEINWPNPQANATPTITVTDSEGTSVSASWTITVTTNGFKFIDAVRGTNAANNGCSSNCGTGTLQSPWRTLTDLVLNDSPSDITYFRAGTYAVAQIPNNYRQSTGGVWERVVFSESSGSSASGSVMWIGYPGETPVLEFACSTCTYGVGIRHSGQSVYIDGFETRNSNILAFQFEPTGALRGPTYRRLNMHHHGPGGDGTNASFIMTTSFYPSVAYGAVIQDSTFANVTALDPDDAVTVKIYSQIKTLIEDTVHRDAVKALELKADVRQFTVRNNRFYNLTGAGIGGNMHGCVGCSGGSDTQTTRGEVLYNMVQSSAEALDLNQDGQALEVHAYRNTLIGRVMLRNADGADGPFYLSRNVIVNSDAGTPSGSHVYQLNVSAPSRLLLTQNLAGYASDGIVDANGNLTAAYAQYVGTHGHQSPNGSGSTLPTAPRNLRITTP